MHVFILELGWAQIGTSTVNTNPGSFLNVNS
jgi:hypothetical protein